tara:strand:- start:2222 stop:3007 length:786 start_codon:yes stop_codon:yes gene_type:complete
MTEENIFKKIPKITELKLIVSRMINNWESKLNLDHIDKEYEKMCTDKSENSEKNEIIILNELINNTLKELSVSTISQLLSGINRYIKNPYSKELTQKIMTLHTLFDSIQDKCFSPQTKASITILLIGILISKIIRFYNNILDNENINVNNRVNNISYITWYYGNYNSIIEKIMNLKDVSIFWMDESISWEGYNSEEVVVIPIEDSIDDSKQSIIIRCYLKSISSFMKAQEVFSYIIVSKNAPPNFYIENGLLDPKNISNIL